MRNRSRFDEVGPDFGSFTVVDIVNSLFGIDITDLVLAFAVFVR